jgi:hypothetical protein
MKNDLMKQPGNGKKILKNIGFGFIILSLAAVAYMSYSNPDTLKNVILSDVVTQANNGEIDKLTLVGDRVEVTKKGESKASEIAFKKRVKRRWRLSRSHIPVIPG